MSSRGSRDLQSKRGDKELQQLTMGAVNKMSGMMYDLLQL